MENVQHFRVLFAVSMLAFFQSTLYGEAFFHKGSIGHRYPDNALQIKHLKPKNYFETAVVCWGAESGMGFGMGPASDDARPDPSPRRRGDAPKRLTNFQDLDPALLNRLDPRGIAQSSLAPSTPEALERFQGIVEAMVACEEVTELGPVLAPEVEFLLTHNATQLMDQLQGQIDDEKEADLLNHVFDFMYNFLEDVVDQTLQVQKRRQKSLRQIMESAKQGPEALDEKIAQLGKDLDLGFLDYLDVEIERLSQEEKAPMLPIIATIRARVCTEIEEGLGVEVAALSKIVQYDDDEFRELSVRNFVGGTDSNTVENFNKLVTATLDDMEQRQITGDGLAERLKDIKRILEEII